MTTASTPEEKAENFMAEIRKINRRHGQTVPEELYESATQEVARATAALARSPSVE